jgi:DNA-binding response OmpR family regulator
MLSASALSPDNWLAGLHPLEASQPFRAEEGAFVPRVTAHLRPDRTHPVGVPAFWTASGSEIHSIGRDPTLGRDPSEDAIRFRRFQLFPSARLLLRDGRPIEIGSRAFDLLTILLASRGSVVSKEEIFRHVWPSTVVEESNLRWQMVSLRKVLGEDGDLIKTIPGRGYLFACEAGEAGNGVRESNPLAPAPSASDLGKPAVSFPHDPVSGNEPVVVVIDNDPNIREAIYGLLRSVGLHAECFATVQEFTDSVPPSPPCCLILDVWLPGQNGLDFQAQLARANVHIPVIFVTGHADVHVAVRAMKAGAFEFLTKPVRHEELLNAVKAAIALSIDQRDQPGGRRTAA